MKVRSQRSCFYHGRRWRPGEVFELPKGLKPSHDMEIVDEKKGAKPGATEPRKSRRREAQPETLADLSDNFVEEIKA